jgi:hypothetical protein
MTVLGNGDYTAPEGMIYWRRPRKEKGREGRRIGLSKVEHVLHNRSVAQLGC